MRERKEAGASGGEAGPERNERSIRSTRHAEEARWNPIQLLLHLTVLRLERRLHCYRSYAGRVRMFQASVASSRRRRGGERRLEKHNHRSRIHPPLERKRAGLRGSKRATSRRKKRAVPHHREEEAHCHATRHQRSSRPSSRSTPEARSWCTCSQSSVRHQLPLPSQTSSRRQPPPMQLTCS